MLNVFFTCITLKSASRLRFEGQGGLEPFFLLIASGCKYALQSEANGISDTV